MNDDLISREALYNAKPEFMNEKVIRDTKYRTTKDRIYAKAWNACNSYWLDTIDNAPTVEFPEQITIKCDTEEDKQKLLSALRNVKLKAVVEEERPQGEWIPVSERLPHAEYGESDTVLVSACWISDKDLKDKAIFVTEAYFDGSCFRRPTGEVYWNIKVIAWQPLPEPYKEAENE